ASHPCCCVNGCHRWRWSSAASSAVFTPVKLALAAVGTAARVLYPRSVSARRLTPSIEVLAFVVGAASLGTEIAAARLLAPYFGASTIVWANTIATVLVALAIG